ncbi:MAG: GNAT family N-acetyltransferase, partial [Longimicrobiales bacterium]
MPSQPGSGQRYRNLSSVVLIPHTLMTQVVDLGSEPDSSKLKAATLLVDHFDEPRGWPNLESARDEVARVLREGFAFAAMDGNDLLGWVGGLPEYHGRVWELHPMVVRREHRRRGIGRTLVSAFEAGVADRGGLTITLGTDDDSGMTSLSGIDLYTNIPKHIAELRDLGRGHPFGFYHRLGFVVTGVMPDANGRGFPDIYMS